MTSAGRRLARNPRFRAVLASYGLSAFGDAFLPVSLASGILLAGGSLSDLGVPLAVAVIARLATVLLGGTTADQWPPVRVIVSANSVRAVANAVLALLFMKTEWNMLLLCVAVACASAAGSFSGPAAMVVKQAVVSPAERGTANAAYSFAHNIGLTAGPAIAGVVVAFAGAGNGFLVNCLTCALSAILVSRVRVERPRERRASLLRQLRGGLRAVLSRRWLRAGIGSATIYHLATGVMLVLTPAIAVRTLGGPEALGSIHAAMGVGSLVGALLAVRVKTRRVLVGAWIPLAISSAFPLAYFWPGALPTVLLAAAGSGAAVVYFGVLWDTYLQNTVPAETIGRVYSWDTLSSLAMMPVGNLLAAPLADAIGIRATLVGACGVMVAFCLTPLLTRATWAARSTDGGGL